MGNQPSVPKPGTKLQVIGAGLPQTGTASFSEALRILLDGPVYHGGTQTVLGKPIEIKSWIELLSQWPPSSEFEAQQVKRIISERLDGFASTTDMPSAGLTKEILELNPDAKVICTVRDPDAWVKSMDQISHTAMLWFLDFVLLPIPGMRLFPNYISGLRKAWIHLYGEDTPITRLSYDRHVGYLKRVVPADQLFFFDVREGWEPLCKMLGKEVPDIPFPKINDGKAIDELAARMIKKGLMRWALIIATFGMVIVSYLIMGR